MACSLNLSAGDGNVLDPLDFAIGNYAFAFLCAIGVKEKALEVVFFMSA